MSRTLVNKIPVVWKTTEVTAKTLGEGGKIMNLTEGTKIYLTTGEVFVLDNEMRTNRSCTVWDVLRFREKGILKGGESA